MAGPGHPAHLARGSAAEEQALAFLQGQGLSLVARNFRCRGGEIDLIMREGAEIVFVEVRARASSSYGGAAGSITARKQARVVLAAQVFLQKLSRLPACRFDVVAFEGDRLHWLRGAFTL